MTTLVWNCLPEYETGSEDEYATYHGVPRCVGVDNGTNAIKPTAVAIDTIGAVRVFVDIDLDA